MMSGETSSFILHCWQDQQTGIIQVQVVDAGTGEEVQFADGSYLLRVSVDTDASVVHCFIRHVASGQEIYLQGSEKLQVFVKRCLLKRHG
jgi:hypothetical protein